MLIKECRPPSRMPCRFGIIESSTDHLDRMSVMSRVICFALESCSCCAGPAGDHESHGQPDAFAWRSGLVSMEHGRKLGTLISLLPTELVAMHGMVSFG